MKKKKVLRMKPIKAHFEGGISRAIEQGFEYDLWIKTARLNTIYIPTWNNKNGDFGEISPFLFLIQKKMLLMSCTLTNKNVYLIT